MKKSLLSVLAFIVVLSACNQTANKTETPEAGPDPLRAMIDTNVSPSDDFAQYASGGWFKANPIPGHRSSNGIWQMVGDSINKAVREICEKSAATQNAARGSAEQKIGDFYASGMDTVNIESKKLQPVQPLLDAINAMQTTSDLMTTVAELRKSGVGSMFGMYVGRDDKISDKYAVFLYQGGLGLPDRDYYLLTDGGSVALRNEYNKHLARLLQINGLDSSAAKKAAADVLALETKLAKASRRLEDLRDPYSNYNKMPLDALHKAAPNMEWPRLQTALGFNRLDSVIVGQPEFFKEVNGLVKLTPLQTWKNYLTIQVLNDYGAYLHKDLDNAVFDFYYGKMSGVKTQKPRWERVVEQTNSSLGELVGQIYVRDYLPKGTKEKMEEIGKNIIDVYRERLKKLDWMSDSTKQKALVKLGTVNMKLGYPDKWKDYSALDIDRESYAGNVMRANQWRYNYNMSKYGKPVNKDEWEMTPQTYNAYYSPSANEIVIPGCNIIVPGFKGLPDDAVLYAIIGGSTFGHEITHGFDDQGSKYDEKGNLRNWWSKEDSANFAQRANALVEQYNA
ncbi:MAG TPA: M13 family metallopeptidase, partial [Chitinophagales bacterium]|nr:M13 family metallopeptidase [Chitinophagales bacterium]